MKECKKPVNQARIQGGGVVTPPALDHQFSFFQQTFKVYVDYVTWAMSKGGACDIDSMCKSAWVYFSIFRRADDVTRTMSKGGGCL